MIFLRSSLLKRALHPKSAKDLWPALQHAIQLEHSTIPLYLFALYSLKASANAVIGEIVRSVVLEEMLHMTLASNVLNALGGSPCIDQPNLIPKYPGPLPGGIRSGLIVHLAPFSTNQLDTFLQIEEPEDPINYPSPELMTTVSHKITIGQFYLGILAGIKSLGDGAFVKPPRNQVGPDVLPESVVVSDVDTARKAINIIIDQGEGTRRSPLEVVGHRYAHYYRYMQIYQGRLLLRKNQQDLPPDEQYTYTGEPVPLEQGDAFPVPPDPTSDYPPGSAQAIANNDFNYTYTCLLAALHAMFNGANAQEQLGRVMGLMMSLKEQAIAMMSGVASPNTFFGPSFQYLKVNP